MSESPAKIELIPDGPPDEVETDQGIVYEESESDDPNAETAMENVQDVRP